MQGVLDIPAELEPVQRVLLEALARVEVCFDEQLASDLPPVATMCAHIERYRGKMLRPMIVLLSGMAATEGAAAAIEAGNGASLITEDHIVLAAVCEMVHMATLVHDDVLDEAQVRRRGRTLNDLYGNETAVILGDYLIASAYHLCSSLDAQVAARLIGHTSMAMCAGELLQLHHRDDWSLDEPTYYEILSRKTAALIGAACELGTLATVGYHQPDHSAVVGLREFGHKLGIAFQIQDDLLDLMGDEAVVGKSVGKDLEKGKLTLPLIHHLRACSPTQRGRSLILIQQAVGDPRGPAGIELVAAIAGTDSIGYASAQADRLVGEARALIKQLPASPARQLLDELAKAVVSRAY